MSITVVHYADPTRPWVIPNEQYDPAVHTLWDERHAQPKPRRARKAVVAPEPEPVEPEPEAPEDDA